ncbi:MAG: ABC transporter ATP-binding protein [Anaerofustis stercorihominis]|nr:ABC transporter ATP-binding protein [Anaerofustis stercorihominis]
MFKLFKRIDNLVVPLLICVLLLSGQVWTELELPVHTANIINVGIQQGGIEQAVPEVMTPDEYDSLTALMSSTDEDIVEINYSLIDSSDPLYTAVKEEYPNIPSSVYVLNETVTEGTMISLDTAFSNAILMKTVVAGTNENYKQYEEQLHSLMQEPYRTEKDLEGMLSAMEPEKADEFIATAQSLFTNISTSLVNQAAIDHIKTSYEVLGFDIVGLQMGYLFSEGGIMLLVAGFATLISIVMSFVQSRLGSRIGTTLRKLVFGKVITLSNQEMENFSTASLITRTNNDVMQIARLMNMGLRHLIFSPLMGIGGIIKAIKLNASLSWIMFVAVAFVTTGVTFLLKFVTPKFKIMQKNTDRINLVVREVLNGLPVIRAFSTFDYEESRFADANERVRKLGVWTQRRMGLMMPAMMLTMNISSVAIVWFGAKAVNLGGMQVGDITAYVNYAMHAIMSFQMLANMSTHIPRAMVSAGRINEILDSENIIKDPVNPTPFVEDKMGEVEFRNVSFAYPDADGEVLTDITFTAKAGETTAIIGGTGCGKSTLINLVPRFYDVTGGEILVNGVNIKDMTQHDLRAQLGYVPQKGLLFSGTIESNIRFGDINMSDEDVLYAADIAQAANFIENMPYGYYEPIAQGGTNVSGGQKQRLSIARAIAPKPNIYLFDDSFSALDFKTDAALRKALNEKLKGATKIIVAQRISTIMHAENILVLDEGKIVGQGTHEDLLKNCEVYKEIAYSQLSEEELNND